MSVTPVKPGDVVIAVDSHGKSHNALVTAVHGVFYDGPSWTEEEARTHAEANPGWWDSDEERENWINGMVGQSHTVPSINCTFVSDDESKRDPYGQQLERNMTSVCHESVQAAHGYFWRNY